MRAEAQAFRTRGSLLLPEERRRGTAVLVGKVELARVELDPAAVEAEERREDEASVAIRIVEIVSSAVQPQIVEVLETLRMGQEHAADSERSEPEFDARVDHHHAGPADGTTAVTDAELGGNDQDVRIALSGRELREELLRANRLAETLLVDLTCAVVVELAVAGLLDHSEHLEHGLAVRRTEELRVLDPVGDREPAFGELRQRDLALLDRRDVVVVGESESGEEHTKRVALLGERLPARRIAGEIAVGRLHLLVLELVGDRQVLERDEGRLADGRGELVTVCVDALGAVLVETELLENLLDGIGTDAGDLLELAGRCGNMGKRRHDVSPFHILGTPRVGCPIDEASILKTCGKSSQCSPHFCLPAFGGNPILKDLARASIAYLYKKPIFYASSSSFRSATPIATSNSGPTCFKTLSRNAGASTLRNGSATDTSV